MKTEQIFEGNRLIAEFMNVYLQNTVNLPKWYYKNKSNNLIILGDELLYHLSWNWLMPVVEKIESIKDTYHGYFGVHIISNNCTIQATNFKSNKPIANPPYYFADYTLNSKIESTWHAVVEFIKWYNNKIEENDNKRATNN